MKKTLVALLLPLAFGIATNDAISSPFTTLPYSFSAGNAAVAGEVNDNFTALESGINSLESKFESSIVVDCDADANNLQTALDDNKYTHHTIFVDVSGSCNPIGITRNNVAIFTNSTASIVGDGSAPESSFLVIAAVAVIGAQNVSIDGVSLSGNNATDTAGITLANGASVTLSNLVVSDAPVNQYQINVFNNSTLILGGGVDIDGDMGVAVEQSSSLIAFGGSNDIDVTSSTEPEAIKAVGGSSVELNDAIDITGDIEIDTAYLRAEELTLSGTAFITNGGTLSLRSNGTTHSLGGLEVNSRGSAELAATSISGSVFVYGSALVLEQSSSISGTTTVAVSGHIYIDDTSSTSGLSVRNGQFTVDGGTIGSAYITTFSVGSILGAATASSGITVTDSNVSILGTTDLGTGTITTTGLASAVFIQSGVDDSTAVLTCNGGRFIANASVTCP